MDEQQNIIIYRTADGRASVALFAKDGKIWLNQQQMAELFATSKSNISMHIANILKENELTEVSVVKNFLTTAADGKNYNDGTASTRGQECCALLDVSTLDDACDLSVKNPNKVEEVDERTPGEIAQSIFDLNSENQTLINEIMEMVK